MLKTIMHTTYHWKTLAVWVVFLALYTFVPPNESLGGCSGCFPNDAGEIMCTNTCGKIFDLLPYAVVSYIVALILVLAYKKFITVKK